LLLFLSSCSELDISTTRAKNASENKEILIGAVWPWTGQKGSLWNGIELALDQANQGGGVLGRKIRIQKEDDEASLAKGRLIAQKFSENKDMVAVIGHLNSYIALPAAYTYQSGGLVYLTPGASDYQINLNNYDLVFRSSLSNRSIGRNAAEYMHRKKYKNIGIIYLKDKTNRGMANYFEQRARELGMNLIDRRSYNIGSEDFSQITNLWKNLYKFDAIFIAGNMPAGGKLIESLRAEGINAPILAGDGMDTPFFPQLNKVAEGVVLPLMYNLQDNSELNQNFVKSYKTKYNKEPDTFAAQGYDALNLVLNAIRISDSAVPEKIAKSLHQTKRFQGVTGSFTYNELGDMVDREVRFKMVKNSQYVVID
jgi:branched-chain amino acid transport system substrate-binding protein